MSITNSTAPLECDERKTLSNQLLKSRGPLQPFVLTFSKIVCVPKAAEIELQQKPCDKTKERERERGCEDRSRAKQIASRLTLVSHARHGPKIVSWEF